MPFILSGPKFCSVRMGNAPFFQSTEHFYLPIHLLASSTSLLLCSALLTWQTRPDTSSFSDCSAVTALSTFSCFLLLIITLAPSCPRRLAMAKPILKDKMHKIMFSMKDKVFQYSHCFAG